MPNLFIDIEARFAKFQDSLDRIKRDSDKFVNGLTKSFGLLRSVGVGLGAGIGLSQLATQFRDVVNAADELNNVSERSGIAVESLSELKFAAELSNVSFEELQKGLVAFAKAVDGLDKSFERIGLDPKQFQSVEQALDAVADKLAKIEDPFAQAAIAAALFGKNGVALLPLLKQGAAGIQAFREEAKRLNVVISSDFAKSADQYNDNIQKLGNAWDGFARDIASGPLQVLTQLTEKLLAASKAGGSLPRGIDIVTSVNPFGDTLKQLQEVRREIEALEKQANDVSLSGDSGEFGFFGGLTSKADELETKLKRSRETLKFLESERTREIENDPKLQELAKKGQGVRDNTNITNQGRISVGSGGDTEEGGTKSKAVSDFDTIRRSLISQLQSEKKLTEELTLLEDERYSRLAPAQQRQLRGIALTIDAIRQEKTNRESIDSATSAEASIREESLRTELDAIERRKLVLSQSYEDSKLSAQAYYTAVARAETESTLLRINNLRQIADAQEEIADDPDRSNDEQLNAKVRLASIQREIIELTREQADIATRTERAIRQADEETLRRKIEIAQQVNQAQGIQNPELDRAALLDQFKDLPADFKQTLTFKVFIDTQLAQKQIDEFERNAGVIEQTLRVTEERVNIDRGIGISSETESQQKIIEARRTAIVGLEEQVRKFEELRIAQDASFSPESAARLESLRNKIAELKGTTDDYLRGVREVGEGPLADFFTDIITGADDAKLSIENLGKAIKANVGQKLSREFSDQLFSGFGKATKEGEKPAQAGLFSLLQSGAQEVGGFFGFGQGKQKPPVSFGGNSSSLFDSSVSSFSSSATSSLTSDASSSATSAAFESISTAAEESAFSLTALSSSATESNIGVDLLSSSLTESAPQLSDSLVSFGQSAVTAEAGTQGLTASIPTATASVSSLSGLMDGTGLSIAKLGGVTEAAAAAIARAAATVSVFAASADGNVFSGGYQVAFANGGAFDDGALQKFATGGIVSKPTTFPIKDGRTGLMGEAGPEAIMPLTRGMGGFAVYAVDADGQETTLSIARNSQGKLAVKLPSAEGGPAFAKGAPFKGGKPSTVTAFALGGAFKGGIENYVMKFADGGVFTSTANNMASLNAESFSSQSSSIQSAIHSNQSRLDVLPFKAYAYGGIANKPQLAMFGEGSRPEAFVPLPDGRTIPVTMEGQAGAGVNITMNVKAEDAQSFRRSRASITNELLASLGIARAQQQ